MSARTECRAYLRMHAGAMPVLCGAQATVETWAIGPNGEATFHVARCDAHPDPAPYSSTRAAGWVIEYRRRTALTVTL